MSRTPRVFSSLRAGDVVDFQCHMMQPGAAPGQEFRNRRVIGGCLEQLQRRIAQRDEVRAHALRLNVFRGIYLEAQCVAVERQRVVQIGYGNPDVIKSRAHDCHFRLSRSGISLIPNPSSLIPHP